jgi:hypothetical protein
MGVDKSVAAVLTYSSSASFFAGLGSRPFTTEGYESFPINSTISSGTTLNGITYSSFPTGTIGRIDDIYNKLGNASLALQRGVDSTSFFFPGESFSVAFAAPVSAIGIFFNANIAPTNSLFIQTAEGTARTGGATYDTGTLYFAGLISDTTFTTATIGGLLAGSTFNVDNLTLAQATNVPEPSSLPLHFVGIVAVLRYCWHRRRRTSVRPL